MDRSNLQGFTLVELVVLISTLGLFVGIGTKAYTDYRNNKRLETETRNIVSFLESAKKKIMSGDKHGITTTCTLSGFTVEIVEDGYSLYALCPENVQVGSKIDTDNNVELGLESVTFKPFGTGSSGGCVVVSDSENGICREVKVDTAGTVTYTNQMSTCVCP